jgi:hypothetical protein
MPTLTHNHEIEWESVPVREYGWALLAGHASVLGFFLSTGTLLRLIRGKEALCWPYFPNCEHLRLGSVQELSALLLGHSLLLLLCALSFQFRPTAFKKCLLALNIYVFAIMSLDYSFRGNEFYMLLWLNGVYLLGCGLRWTIPVLLISFYFWAGCLKLNREWMSGAVLYHKLWFIPPRFVPFACTYVILLEMVLIWGLLSKRRAVRWCVLIQLCAFHIESLSQIHWFYPVLMATMLSWFVMDDYGGGESGRPSLVGFFWGRAPRAVYIVALTFAALQVQPHLFHGDSALTGQGRVFALHMFEARQVCNVRAALHWKDRTVTTYDLLLPDLAPRMICDPIVYYDRVQTLCSRVGHSDLLDVDFFMQVKRTTDANVYTVVDEAGFCTPARTYKLLGNNDWLR